MVPALIKKILKIAQTVIKIEMKYSVIPIKRPKLHKKNEASRYMVSELEDKIIRSFSQRK